MPRRIKTLVDSGDWHFEKLADVSHVLLLATLQHSLAVASMLAPTVKTVCVDIDPSAVERGVEHQPLQSIGLVTDVEPFLRELTECIADSEAQRGDRKETMRRQ